MLPNAQSYLVACNPDQFGYPSDRSHSHPRSTENILSTNARLPATADVGDSDVMVAEAGEFTANAAGAVAVAPEFRTVTLI